MSNSSNKYLLSAHLIFTLVAYAFFNTGLMIGSLLFSIYLLVRGVQSGVLNKKNLGISWNILILTIIVFLILSPLALWKSLHSLYFIFSSVAGLLLAYMSSRRIEDVYFALRFVLMFVISYLLLYAAQHFPDNPFPFEDFLKGSGSSNVVTSFLIILQCSYSATAFIYLKKITWTSLFLSSAICFIAYGRGSIVASLLLIFLFVCIWFLLRRKSFIGFIQIAFAIIFISIIYLFFSGEILEFLMSNTKLGSGLVDDSRLLMINDYLGALNGSSLLTGASYRGTVIDEYFDGNPHNSFIRAHHMLGIFYIASILFLIFSAVAAQKSLVNLIFVAGILLIMMFRAFSEPIIFPTPLDFYFYIVIFCSLDLPPINRTSHFSKKSINLGE